MCINGVLRVTVPASVLNVCCQNFYYNLNDDALGSTTKPEAFRKLLFGAFGLGRVCAGCVLTWAVVVVQRVHVALAWCVSVAL